MANSKAHFALNMSQCTYSAGWYTIEGFMTLQLEDFFAKPSAFQWKMIFITFPFNDVTPLYYVFLFLFNAFFLQFIQRGSPLWFFYNIFPNQRSLLLSYFAIYCCHDIAAGNGNTSLTLTMVFHTKFFMKKIKAKIMKWRSEIDHV